MCILQLHEVQAERNQSRNYKMVWLFNECFFYGGLLILFTISLEPKEEW